MRSGRSDRCSPAGFGEEPNPAARSFARGGAHPKATAVAVATTPTPSVDEHRPCASRMGRGSRVPQHGVVRPAAEARLRRAAERALRLAGRCDELGAVGGRGGASRMLFARLVHAATEDVALGGASPSSWHTSRPRSRRSASARAGHRVHVDRVPVARPGSARDRRPVRPPRSRRRDRRRHRRRRVQRRPVVDGRGGADGRDRPVARHHDALVVVDATQAVGWLPVHARDADLLCAPRTSGSSRREEPPTWSSASGSRIGSSR